MAVKDKVLILLHGRGANGDSMMPLAREFANDTFYVETPEAPRNNAWYPNPFMAEDKLNEPYLTHSLQQLESVIEKYVSEIGYEGIYLMGFSQGACLSLEVAARNPQPYGGVIAFSGGLIGETLDPKKYSGRFNGTKIYIGLSEKDPYIPLIRAQESAKLLESMGAVVTFESYPGNSHTVTPLQLETVRKLFFKG